MIFYFYLFLKKKIKKNKSSNIDDICKTFKNSFKIKYHH